MNKPTRPVVAGVLVMTWALAAGQASRRSLEAFDLDVRAPERLADTGLYEDGRPGRIDPRNRPFSPQYPLWSDGAAKSRWVYVPEGSTIDVTDPGAWSGAPSSTTGPRPPPGRTRSAGRTGRTR